MLKLENIKAEMARRNVTGLELAKTLKISPTTFYLKINGKRQFTANEVGVISEKLKTPINFFYNTMC